ncbi:MAG: hypothetical protein HYZ52_00240 [Candidatus Omnitrophica bacterium]|nr:hypothetical protein [Candidatus Omnitrophota bacterium]
MMQITTRQLIRNFSKYLKFIKQGERIILLEGKIPVADFVPHNQNFSVPGWKRKISKIKLKGVSLSKMVIHMRNEARF